MTMRWKQYALVAVLLLLMVALAVALARTHPQRIRGPRRGGSDKTGGRRSGSSPRRVVVQPGRSGRELV